MAIFKTGRDLGQGVVKALDRDWNYYQTSVDTECMSTRSTEGFKKYLIDNDRKPRSVIRHLNNFTRISSHAPNFTKEQIDGYFIKLKEQGCKNTYLNSMINTIRVYAQYKTLGEELAHFKFRKKEIFSKATLSDEEIEAFLDLPPEMVRRRQWSTGKEFFCAANPKVYARWTIFFKIMAFTGMRPGEVAYLKVRNIDFGRQVFIIEDSKTNQPGIAPIAPNILPQVQEYIKDLGEDDYLFPSNKGGNKDGVTPVFDNVDWHYNFHKRLKRLGIKRLNLTPYSLRHSYATRLLESDVSLFHVKKLLRHSDLKSTLVYEHLTTADLIRAVQKLPLVRKGTTPQNILQSIVELIKTFKIEQDSRFSYQLEESDHSVRFEVYIKSVAFLFIVSRFWETIFPLLGVI